MPRIVFTEYRDKYKDTVYPFADNATLVADDELTTFPPDMLLDASFYIPDSSELLYLSEIRISNDKAVFIVADYRNNTEISGTCVAGSDVINLYDIQNKQVGVIIGSVNLFQKILKFGIGSVKFDENATPFSTRCIIPLNPKGVTSVGLTGVSKYLTGDVWLIGTDGVVLRTVEPTDEDTTVIRVDIIGDPLFKTATCEGDSGRPDPVITQINDISPDQYGNIIITANTSSDIIRVNTDGGGIVISAVGSI